MGEAHRIKRWDALSAGCNGSAGATCLLPLLSVCVLAGRESGAVSTPAVGNGVGEAGKLTQAPGHQIRESSGEKATATGCS